MKDGVYRQSVYTCTCVCVRCSHPDWGFQQQLSSLCYWGHRQVLLAVRVLALPGHLIQGGIQSLFGYWCSHCVV